MRQHQAIGRGGEGIEQYSIVGAGLDEVVSGRHGNGEGLETGPVGRCVLCRGERAGQNERRDEKTRERVLACVLKSALIALE